MAPAGNGTFTEEDNFVTYDNELPDDEQDIPDQGDLFGETEAEPKQPEPEPAGPATRGQKATITRFMNQLGMNKDDLESFALSIGIECALKDMDEHDAQHLADELKGKLETVGA